MRWLCHIPWMHGDIYECIAVFLCVSLCKFSNVDKTFFTFCSNVKQYDTIFKRENIIAWAFDIVVLVSILLPVLAIQDHSGICFLLSRTWWDSISNLFVVVLSSDVNTYAIASEIKMTFLSRSLLPYDWWHYLPIMRLISCVYFSLFAKIFSNREVCPCLSPWLSNFHCTLFWHAQLILRNLALNKVSGVIGIMSKTYWQIIQKLAGISLM